MRVVKSLLAVSLAVVAVAASAGTIVGSKHDFGTMTGTGGQICIACHAPHNNAVIANAPLWNHQINAAQTYTAYTSFSMDALGFATATPGATSKLCLSCHDGVLALNNFGGVTTGTVNFAAGSKSNLGTDLSNDHPIGIVYDAATIAADGALNPLANAVTIGSAGRTKLTSVGGLLQGTKVECASCHDVHNTFTADAGVKLVKVTMTGSALCITCHNK